MNQEAIDAYNLEKKRQAERRQELDGVNNVSETINNAVKSQTERLLANTSKVKIENDNLAKSEDFSQVVDSINKMNMTTFMSTRGFHDMAENITDLANSVQELQTGLANKGLSEVTSTFGNLVTKLETIAKSLNDTKVKVDSEVTSAVQALRTSIDNLDINPVINLPAPNVTVESSKLDLKPLEKVLKDISKTPESKEEFSLECYMAQDLVGDDVFQYIGMVNPEGNWCIIENDINGGSLRFALGEKNYKTAWKNHNGHSFKLLNEAVNAVSA